MFLTSVFFFQSDGTHKLILRSLTFLREFLQSLSQRNEPGPSSSTLTPSTGIATDPNLLKQHKYEERTRQHKSIVLFLFKYFAFMPNFTHLLFLETDDAKRRAAIRLQAAKNKGADTNPMGTGSRNRQLKGECR